MIWTPRQRETLLAVARIMFIVSANGQALILLQSYRDGHLPSGLFKVFVATCCAVWGMSHLETWADNQRIFRP